MTMEQEQQQRRAGDDVGNNDVDRRRGGAADADAETADAGVARPPRPAPSLHRALPSDPDLAARVRSVPDSAVEEVNRLLLLQLEAEKEKGEEEKETTAALVREFLSSPNADATVNRFLRAVGGKDAKSAVARLVSTLRWRKEANPGERSCEECKKVRRDFFLISGRGWGKKTKEKCSLTLFCPFPSLSILFFVYFNRTRGAITCMCEYFCFIGKERNWS